MKQKDYQEIIDLLLAETGLFTKDELLELLIKTFLMKKKSDDEYYRMKKMSADEIMEEWRYRRSKKGKMELLKEITKEEEERKIKWNLQKRNI